MDPQNVHPEQQTTSRKHFSVKFICLIISASCFLTGLIAGYLFFQNTQIEFDDIVVFPTVTSSTLNSAISPTINISPLPTESILSNNRFELASNGPVIKTCWDEWEGSEQEGYRTETCLEFEKYGRVIKTLNGKEVTNNDSLEDSQIASISKDIVAIADELRSDRFIQWLHNTETIPPMTGGMPPNITLYQQATGIRSTSSQYLITNYIKGNDVGEEAQRFREIYEHLQKYSPQ